MDEPTLYEVEIIKPALKVLRRLPRDLAERITRSIDALAVDPRPRGYKRLKGYENLYRIRVGDWRVNYAIEDDKLIVIVMKIAPRGRAYRNL